MSTLIFASNSTFIIRDGVLYAAGVNVQGQLGTGDNLNRPTLTRIQGLPAGRRAIAVAAAEWHTIVLLDDGSLVASGQNSKGQLGTGDNLNSPTLTRMQGLPAGRRAIAVAVGEWHTIVLLDDGSIAATGRNSAGQLGTGEYDNRKTLTLMPLPAERRAIAVAAGGDHTVVLLDDGSVVATGRNRCGQLGTGDNNNRLTLMPMPLPAGRCAIAVAAGSDHTVVLLDDSRVFATGDNQYCQLGTGDNDDRKTLTLMPLPAERRAIAVATRSGHTAVLLDNGTIFATGRNQYGQLGTAGHTWGDEVTLMPMPLPDEQRAIAVAAGSGHTVVLLDDDSIVTIGYNFNGQLGTRNCTNKETLMQTIMPPPPMTNTLSLQAICLQSLKFPFAFQQSSDYRHQLPCNIMNSSNQRFLPHLLYCDTHRCWTKPNVRHSELSPTYTCPICDVHKSPYTKLRPLDLHSPQNKHSYQQLL